MSFDATPFAEIFPLGEDDTAYTKLTGDHVGTASFQGQDILTVERDGLSLLTREAFRQISHLLRPAHLKHAACPRLCASARAAEAPD